MPITAGILHCKGNLKELASVDLIAGKLSTAARTNINLIYCTCVNFNPSISAPKKANPEVAID